MLSWSIRFWSRLCGLVLLFTLVSSAALAQYQTINATGGTNASNGVQILVGQVGNIQVRRLNVGQWFSSASVPPGTNGGIKFAVNGVSYGHLMNTPFTAVAQALTGAGTEANPYNVTTELRVANTGFTLLWHVRYIVPRDTFSMLVDVLPPAGNALSSKLFFAGDTYLNGGDNGAAFVRPSSGTPDLMGVTKDGQYMVFINAGRPFNHWLSDSYGLASSQITNNGNFTDALNFNVATDNGIGIQWNLGVLTAPLRVPVNMGFTTIASVCGDGTLNGFETCDNANTTNGDGCNSLCQVEANYVCLGQPSVCTPTVCGDGNVQGTEACDDGNTSSNDGCTALCSVETGYQCSGTPTACALCGNGTVTSPPEGCDDSNLTNGDGCNSSCKRELNFGCTSESACALGLVCDTPGSQNCEAANVCGNGVVEGSETCDDGGAAAGGGCNALCRREAGVSCTLNAQCGSGLVCDLPGSDQCEAVNTCGNGTLDSGEICDDGGVATGDGCDASCLREAGAACTLNAQCGTGLVCDLPGSDQCEAANTCGNGTLDSGEICDDGGVATGDGCNASCLREAGGACTLNAQCGTGLVCDLPGSDTCEAANTCGNGAVEGSEACDDGATANGNGCNATCLLEAGQACAASAQCGGGLVCDGLSSHACEAANSCGNGVLEGGEVCDDGGTGTGDGCNGSCLLESGQACAASAQCGIGLVCDTVSGHVCEAANSCGNGVLEGSEVCDDGGTATSDGCNAACFFEAGRACAASSQCGSGLVCDTAGSNTCEAANTCGNGALEASEVCDDGGTGAGDGCDGSCLLEASQACTANAQCGGGLVCDSAGSHSCETAGTCGNGTVDAAEACDDGGISAGGGCDALCRREAGVGCGLDAQCSSGLVCDTAGSQACEAANTCGNGTVDGGEVCDDGGTTAGGGCNALCLLEGGQACTANAQCGAGLVCDALSSHACEAANTCGNGSLDAGEACDDGATSAGDGCNASCLGESGQPCTAGSQCGAGLVCDAAGSDNCEEANTCGNGAVEGSEACDDGGLGTGDGCNAACLYEAGQACTSNAQCGASLVCDTLSSHACEAADTCGNGTLDSGEGCDDGGVGGGDGCNAECRLESGQACTLNAQCGAALVCDTVGSNNCESADACGNGTLDVGEVCDDGAVTAGDGCDAACRREAGVACAIDAECGNGLTCDTVGSDTCEASVTCGNGTLDSGEACDDGGVLAEDGCNAACRLEAGVSCTLDAQCGAGLVCDTAGSDTCEAATSCGNGTLDAGEACDDGGVASEDACDALCQLEAGVSCTLDAQCGAGLVCDAAGSDTCEVANSCGNGTLDASEACDDGGVVAEDGCNALCQLEAGVSCTLDAQCGAGLVCDTAGSDTCEAANSCGNGTLDAGEACDDGATSAGDGCTPGCLNELQAACTVDEECASGLCNGSVCKAAAGAACTADVDCAEGKLCDLLGSDTCEPRDTCGNGTLEGFEVCDDGDVVTGDGCGANCRFEPGISCNSDTDCEGVCDLLVSDKCEDADTCGNGRTDFGSGEFCDDGATTSGDGCGADCLVENGYSCEGSLDCASTLCGPVSNVCEPVGVCGNGVLDDDEACDDGNTNAGDGCASNCSLELGEVCAANADCESGVCDVQHGASCEAANSCGNGAIDTGEACDDGATTAGDGCDAACLRDLGEVCNAGADCGSGVCDATSTHCEAADTCGNGTLDEPEACDDGSTVAGDGCNGACLRELEASCNDDVQCASGLCDSSSEHCEATGVCGNGSVEAGEACDDGGTVTGDGCSAACLKENGQACAGVSDCVSGVCDPVQDTCEAAEACGNGVIETGEGCDDGGTVSGDGCAADCLVELGAACSAGADCGSGTCSSGQCVTPAAPECDHDADCGAGMQCTAGACTAAPECDDDADCGVGMSCEAGTCTAALECTADADCATNEQCLANECRTRVTACAVDADCADGQECVAGECSLAPPVVGTLGGGSGSKCSAGSATGAASTSLRWAWLGVALVAVAARRRREAATPSS